MITSSGDKHVKTLVKYVKHTSVDKDQETRATPAGICVSPPQSLSHENSK
jgi:hypothetical protein